MPEKYPKPTERLKCREETTVSNQFPTWKQIKIGTHKDATTLLTAVVEKHGKEAIESHLLYQLEEMIKSHEFTVAPKEETVDLVMITTQQEHQPEKDERLHYCSIETVLQLMLQSDSLSEGISIQTKEMATFFILRDAPDFNSDGLYMSEDHSTIGMGYDRWVFQK